MGLSVCGISHKTASLDEREIYQFSRAELTDVTADYKELTECEEAAVVATCNRIEFYQFTPDKRDHLSEVIRFYRKRGIKDAEQLRDISYCHQKTTVARHLFKIAAGLDSMVLGEDQVFHQLKDAYSAACAAGGPGKILHKIFHMAFQAGKRVRSETQIGTGPRSVPAAAIEMLKNRLEGKKPGGVLVCGVNEITEIIIDHTSRDGIPVYLANRTPQKAEKLAASFKAKSVPLADVASVLPHVDVVISATSAPTAIFQPHTFRAAADRSSPLYIVDLAIPRDFEAAVGDLPQVILYDLQDIKRYLEHTETMRAGDIPRAKEIIEEQVGVYSVWRAKERQQAKVLKMHRELNKLRKDELERYKEGFRPSEYRALDSFSQTLVKNFMRLLPEYLDQEESSSN